MQTNEHVLYDFNHPSRNVSTTPNVMTDDNSKSNESITIDSNIENLDKTNSNDINLNLKTKDQNLTNSEIEHDI